MQLGPIDVATVICLSITGISIALVFVMRLSLGAVLRRKPPRTPQNWPGLTIMKPLRGADAGLEANLTTFFEQNYPRLQLVFGVHAENDPAVPVVRALMARYPHVDAELVIDSSAIGFNPKVNNLANILKKSKHDLLLISDSNIRVPQGYAQDMVATLLDGDVGLVSSPFRAVDGTGLGAIFERLQLNTFNIMGQCAVNATLKFPCVVGKSMLMRRSELDFIGGLAFLGQFLAEDQVCGEEIFRRGRRVALSAMVIDNVLGPLKVKDFVNRHLRWAGMRRRLVLGGYTAELLINPILVAGICALALRNDWNLLALAIAWLLKACMDWSAERALRTERNLLAAIFLVPIKDLMLAALWVVPFFQHTITWRGNSFRIGKRSRLAPVKPAAQATQPSVYQTQTGAPKGAPV